MFFCVVLWFLFHELLYCVSASECYAYVCVLNRLVSFLILRLWYVNTVHFLGLFFRVSCVFCVFAFSRVMAFSGKLLLSAMDLIVFHSVFCRSGVSGKECILVMW